MSVAPGKYCMKNNIITIRGASYAHVKEALTQWIELYADEINSDLSFKLYKTGSKDHLVKADDRLDIERFFYLVNYLHYPDIDSYHAKVEGFTETSDFEEFTGQKLSVYISDTDTEYDNVFVLTEKNKTFKFDFSGVITAIDTGKQYKYPEINLSSDPEIIKINKKELSKKKEKKSADNLKKRFRILSLIALGCFIVSLLIYQIDIQLFSKITFYLGYGIAFWFFLDYLMLRNSKYYLYCIFIALFFLAYSILIHKTYSIEDPLKFMPIYMGGMSPICLLVIQKPLRIIYLKLFKREPEIEKDGKSANLIYTCFLFLSMFVLPFVIMEILST